TSASYAGATSSIEPRCTTDATSMTGKSTTCTSVLLVTGRSPTSKPAWTTIEPSSAGSSYQASMIPGFTPACSRWAVTLGRIRPNEGPSAGPKSGATSIASATRTGWVDLMTMSWDTC